MSKGRLEYYVHYSMSMVGGFLGGYALLNHHELFGNAQTSNLIHIAMNVMGSNFFELLLRLFDLALYFSGFACSVIFAKYTKLNRHFLSIIFDAITILLLFLMPEGISDFLFLAPVFFAMSFQWNSFTGAGGYVSSCIFSTNNFRQFSTSLCEYFCDKDKKHLQKTKFYGMVLLSFHIGVVWSYVASMEWGLGGVLAGLLPISISGVFIFLDSGWGIQARRRLHALQRA